MCYDPGMTMLILNVVITVSLILGAKWLAKQNTELAGFIMALPISTMIVLALTHAEYADPEVSSKFAKSIFAAIPLSLLFFVPFLLANRFGWTFWTQYGLGVLLLGVGFAIHRYVVPLIA
jgi:hypothetical protein